jgi:hypothetical protein
MVLKSVQILYLAVLKHLKVRLQLYLKLNYGNKFKHTYGLQHSRISLTRLGVNNLNKDMPLLEH